MFITARKAYSTLCLSSAWELTWFVTGPTAETAWARLCEAVPPLLNYCKNCLYACEGIGMHSGSENDQLCGRPARFLRDALIGWDALDTWGTGRNKLALHESYARSSKNIVYWSNIYPILQNTVWGEEEQKKRGGSLYLRDAMKNLRSSECFIDKMWWKDTRKPLGKLFIFFKEPFNIIDFYCSVNSAKT